MHLLQLLPHDLRTARPAAFHLALPAYAYVSSPLSRLICVPFLAFAGGGAAGSGTGGAGRGWHQWG